MANHLTPTELGELCAMKPREVRRMCLSTGVPIYKGRIDKTLFLRAFAAAGHRLPRTAHREAHELATV